MDKSWGLNCKSGKKDEEDSDWFSNGEEVKVVGSPQDSMTGDAG